MKKPKKPADPTYMVKDCTFTSQAAGWNSDTARTIAHALEANANALQTLCNKIGEVPPGLHVGPKN